MTETRPQDLVSHIKEAALDAQSFVKDMDRDLFEGDKKSQQAVIYSLLIVGEAAKKLWIAILSSRQQIHIFPGAA